MPDMGGAYGDRPPNGQQQQPQKPKSRLPGLFNPLGGAP